jgi:transposase InsO family protein
MPGRYLIRDRDGKYPALFDTVLADAGINVVLSGVRIPRMNAVMERWVRTCRRELLNRTLILNQRHLLHALREYEIFYNERRQVRSEPPGSVQVVMFVPEMDAWTDLHSTTRQRAP